MSTTERRARADGSRCRDTGKICEDSALMNVSEIGSNNMADGGGQHEETAGDGSKWERVATECNTTIGFPSSPKGLIKALGLWNFKMR